MRSWIAQSLGRKLIAGLATIMVVASSVFLALLVWLYHGKLTKERAVASTQINLLLQASLENAMLKRDLPGLDHIVQQLGRQENIRRVMIVNPNRYVRFSSDKSMLNKQLEQKQITGTSWYTQPSGLPKKLIYFSMSGARGHVIRSVNPIANKTPCTTCHGSLINNPVNGLLIVDNGTDGISRQTAMTAAGLAVSGLLVVLLALSAVWLFLRRAVVTPVEILNNSSLALAEGDLAVRVPCENSDELAQLCSSFNVMAERLEETLNENRMQQQFMQELIDAVPDGIRVINQQFEVVMANRAYCNQQQMELEQVTSVPCYASSHGRDEACPPSLVTCPLYEIRTSGKPVKVIHHHKRSDETKFHAEVAAAPLNASLDGLGCDLIVESIRDLEKQASVTQEQRLSELGQLATGVAHEIHNPLASVRLGLQAILRSLEKGEPVAEFADYLRQVDGEVDKCIDVTKKLLDLSLPPSEHLQLLSIKTIIPEVASLLNFEAQKAHVELDMRFEDGLRVFATDSELRMLTLNLMQNAFHAMPQGGVLEIRGWREAGNALLSFKDTGAGISSEDMDYIFDPFFSRRADQHEGTGLGLTICRSIARRYGGEIAAESQMGEGAVFIVSMPLADGENVSEEQTEPNGARWE